MGLRYLTGRVYYKENGKPIFWQKADIPEAFDDAEPGLLWDGKGDKGIDLFWL